MTLLAFVVFTIAREHGGRFLSGAMSLLCMHRPWQVPTLCLHCTRNVVRMAFCYSSVALLLVLPKFWLWLGVLFEYHGILFGSVQKLFRMTWFLLPLFLVVPVVVRPPLESF